ncbi:hypothetical protein K491DRAFT_515839 [Lophiostoma macrostomum CBS 122681]|uniref:Zn(2)-C6 fungal-type domain-containing protein n=1 Tax=Lophiostoma macrostomum CBS 122681 TaxID=1314788 RepID=A0A6A6T0Y9_9PLEO|nr:hypothetical protein K491DRAFT_515839 [Lophiostoma macrostomum CBS 122681]
MLGSDPASASLPLENARPSTSGSGRVKHARSLAPKPPDGEVNHAQRGSNRRQSKSRNGCLTCKAKRMKCDETKPSCQQCVRRRVVCGGYQKDLRWKPFGKPKDEKRRDTVINTSDKEGDSLTWPPCGVHGESSNELVNNDDMDDSPSFGDSTTLGFGSSLYSNIQPIEDPEDPDFWSLLFNMNEAPEISNFLPPSIDPDMAREQLNQFYSDQDSTTLWMDAVADANIQTFDLSSSHLLLPDSEEDSPLFPLPQPQRATQETISSLFEKKTSNILSIRDDPSNNPWRTLIWPLAKDSPALYHAIAAMTCLHLSKSHIGFHTQGLEHISCSMQALASSVDDSNSRLDTTIAAMLALAFAHSWDYQKTSTGIDHIQGAKILVQQIISAQNWSGWSPKDMTRLRFLTHTCIYMDVIARLTTLNYDPSGNSNFIAACNTLNLGTEEHQLDPLMGYASTLFPLIGRVADLVGCVRRRQALRNSPAIISQGIELKKAVEEWVPLANLGTPENATYTMVDAIQTAEAYRWATLLLLRQAVPELPSLYSWWELAQKVLVFLATIPLTSRTRIVQIFPLVVAGCEATEQEDRDWVQERWGIMAQCMITGIVDRCLKVTKEVWKRRDENIPSCNACRMSRESSSSLDAGMRCDPLTAESNSHVCPCATGAHSISGFPNFPDSAAFKKGAEALTRAGHMGYTVKGKMHWLGVMKEWDWEVMLG